MISGGMSNEQARRRIKGTEGRQIVEMKSVDLDWILHHSREGLNIPASVTFKGPSAHIHHLKTPVSSCPGPAL